MHILIPVFFRAPQGGLHENILSTAKFLVGSGRSVTVVCPGGIFASSLPQHGINVIETDFQDFDADYERVMEIHVAQPIDLVHAHPFASRKFGLFVAETLDIPFVLTLSVARVDRERLNGHLGKVLWFTGLSGSGKSTLANALEVELHRQGMRTYILDGDNIRQGLNKDIGFTDADRVENIRRIAEVAKLMLDAGLIVMTAFISPFRQEREMARELIGAENFIEVFVDTPLEVCEGRDVKGLYKKARAGKIPNMTGINSPYEAPQNPDFVADTRIERNALVGKLVNLIGSSSDEV